tara:strand:+ start:2015 stop:3004 length:990 start_codon:yes stop_codon:yes gene_type:complete
MINKILIYNSGGGLGDSIQLFPLILSLKNHFNKAEFFYLGAHDNHYENQLRDYNIKIKTLDLGLKYFGFRWWHLLKVKKQLLKKNIDKFDLIIDLQTKLRNSLILKMISTKYFYSATYKFSLCSIKNKYYNKKNISEMTLFNLEKFFNNKINRVNYNLNNIKKEFYDEAKKLLPNNNYIGFSITQGNEYRKKSWPLKNFIDLAKKILIIKKTPVFFLEKSNIEVANKIKSEIPEAIIPEHKSNFSSPALVTALSSRLEGAISIDNGVMHMIALSNVPIVVLFGPTNSEKFAPSYKDSIILDSKKVYNTENISAITVEDVLLAAKQFLNF